MKALIADIVPTYQQLRQQIHQHPELRYEESNTAQLIVDTLQKLGLQPLSGIGKTGVIAVLDSGKPGKTIGLRADMDALPIQEASSTLPYCSKHANKMHACGHDGHVATLLGVAHVLSKQKEAFKGKVKFIFQPAEEGGAGAKAMIQDGVLQNPPLDAIFAYHNHPGTGVGQILAKTGCTMYGNWEFSITLQGRSGHAAMPEMAINPLSMSADVIQAVNEMMQGFLNEPEPTVMTVTQMQGGITTNIIPDTAIISGTIRAASNEKYLQAKEQLNKKLKDIETRYHGKIELSLNPIYPPTINTKPETDFVLKEATELLGKENVQTKASSGRASEDFSYFLEKVPGCYFFIGNGEDSPSCHNAHFDFNDGILPVGIELLSTLSIKYLNQNTD